MTSVSPNSGTWVRAGLQWLLLGLCLGAAGYGQLLLIGPDPKASAVPWALATVAGILAYFIGRETRALPAPERREMSPLAEAGWLALVLLVGLYFVAYRISDIPSGLNHDAAWEGMYAIRILNGEPYTPYAREAWGRETMTFYFRAAAIWLMGPTKLAVQAPGMLAGFLLLPFFYWWARTMFGVRLALVATLFLAASGWHLVFSRTGWRSDFQPFFMAMTACFFFRGLQTAKSLHFLASGVSLALTLNTYNGARVYPAVFALWLPLLVVQSWQLRGFLRRYGVGLAFMALGFAVVIYPLAWYAYNDWQSFQGRATALAGLTTLREAAISAILLFNFSGNGDDFFVREPGLEVPTAVLWVFGVLWCLLRWRDPRAQFLLIGMVINLVPGLVSKPNLNRNIGTMVFVYFFAGLGAMFFAQQIRALLGRYGRVAAAAFLIAVGSAAAVATHQQYLGENRRPIWGYYPETTVVGLYLKEIIPDYAVWVGGANFPRDTLTYLSYQGSGPPIPRYTWLDDVRILQTTRPSPPPGKGLAFVLAADGPGAVVLRELAQRYPEHTMQELRYPVEGGRIFAKALLVPPDRLSHR